MSDQLRYDETLWPPLRDAARAAGTCQTILEATGFMPPGREAARNIARAAESAREAARLADELLARIGGGNDG